MPDRENEMTMKVKLVKGQVKNTGWPIDGHTLTFALWSFDHAECYHLYSWDDADDEAVMQTIFLTLVDAGFESAERREEFEKEWAADEFEAPGGFCIDLNKVNVIDLNRSLRCLES